MLILRNECSVLEQLNDDEFQGFICKNHSRRLTDMIIELFTYYHKLIYFPLSFYYIPDKNIIRINLSNSESLYEKLKQYKEDYYYFLDISKNGYDGWMAEIIHYSHVPVTGEALSIIRTITIEEAFKD